MTDAGDKERNERVYGWVRDRLGTSVGRGECWDLADGALRHAGARSSTTTGKKDDYVWGRRIEVSAVMRGDILQFRNYTVKTTAATKITYADGARETREETSSMTRGHHTAIVAANNGAKGLEILEQNAPEGSPSRWRRRTSRKASSAPKPRNGACSGTTGKECSPRS